MVGNLMAYDGKCSRGKELHEFEVEMECLSCNRVTTHTLVVRCVPNGEVHGETYMLKKVGCEKCRAGTEMCFSCEPNDSDTWCQHGVDVRVINVDD